MYSFVRGELEVAQEERHENEEEEIGLDDLPDSGVLEPLPLDGLSLDEVMDRMSKLTDDLRKEELLSLRDHLVDSFYNVLESDYGLRRPTKIEYNRFEVSGDGRALYCKADKK